jgi:hypothetical protein
MFTEKKPSFTKTDILFIGFTLVFITIFLIYLFDLLTFFLFDRYPSYFVFKTKNHFNLPRERDTEL